MNVFIARDGATIGEYPREQLEEMARAGEFQQDDHYWQEGMEDWLPLPQLLAPEAWEPGTPPPPPPNYRLIVGGSTTVLLVISLLGFFLVKPDRLAERGGAIFLGAPLANALDESQVRDKAAAELKRMIDRLPSQAAPPLNALYYDVTVNMNRALSVRAPWTAIIRGREDTIDPETGSSVSQTTFTLSAEYEDGEWAFKHYQSSVSNISEATAADREDDESTPTPPSIVGILGLKKGGGPPPMSLKIPER